MERIGRRMENKKNNGEDKEVLFPLSNNKKCKTTCTLVHKSPRRHPGTKSQPASLEPPLAESA